MPVGGALVYPLRRGDSAIAGLQEAAPWSILLTDSLFWFLGVDCTAVDGSTLYPPEPGGNRLTVAPSNRVRR